MLFCRRYLAVAVCLCALAWTHLTPAQAPQTKQVPPPVPNTQSPSDSAAKPPIDSAQSQPDSTKLEPIKTPQAVYPWEAREKQLQGQVWLKIGVSESGDVDHVEIISGDPVLARAAVDAAKKWKFKPFIKNGKPVSVYTKMPFSFAFSENVREEKEPPSPAKESLPSAIPPASAGVAVRTPQRVRVAQGVTTGLLIRRVQPVYPPEARLAGVEGTVVLQATISKEGRITDLKVISGPKELTQAAVGAVQQWRYRPYLLMGDPVEVETTVQVNFQLRR
jgi:TonB family protein